MTNSDGTDAIPALTPAAEELSKLDNLKEVQGKWTRNTTGGTSLFGGVSLFGSTTTTTTTGLGLGLVKRPILKAKRLGRAARTTTPVAPRKRKATATPTPAP